MNVVLHKKLQMAVLLVLLKNSIAGNEKKFKSLSFLSKMQSSYIYMDQYKSDDAKTSKLFKKTV